MVTITTQMTPNPASGNTTTDGSEQTLASSTSLASGGVFIFAVDATNMVDGDVIELRVYSNANSANDRQAYFSSFAHSQSDPLKFSIAVAVEVSGRYKATIKRISGTDRAYQWKVLQL